MSLVSQFHPLYLAVINLKTTETFFDEALVLPGTKPDTAYITSRESFANRLFSRRKTLGLTQEDITSKSGISRFQISKFESAALYPSAENLVKLSHALSCSTDYLLGTESFNCRELITDQEDIDILKALRSVSDIKRLAIINLVRQFTVPL